MTVCPLLTCDEAADHNPAWNAAHPPPQRPCPAPKSTKPTVTSQLLLTCDEAADDIAHVQEAQYLLIAGQALLLRPVGTRGRSTKDGAQATATSLDTHNTHNGQARRSATAAPESKVRSLTGWELGGRQLIRCSRPLLPPSPERAMPRWLACLPGSLEVVWGPDSAHHHVQHLQVASVLHRR